MFQIFITIIMQNIKNPLIFIVENSIIYKDLIVGYLQSKNYKNIQNFKTGEECIQKLQSKPDIIVLDYSYEGISGLETMRTIRSENPEIDFIFLSNQSEINVAINIMKLGAADYIVKDEQAPYRLVKSIEYLLTRTKKEKVQKVLNIGIVGFFIMLFVIIMTLILISIFFDLEL
jgi:DNA-binding NarL/FixJ family response regulator